jgi:ATP-dependent DNA helicase DinG
MYMAAAKMGEMRAITCTSTKGLQDQLSKDFAEISADIRGQSNYQCKEAGRFGIPGWVPVEAGPCKSGVQCDKKGGGCEYFDRFRAAQKSDLISANYALWLYDTFRESQDGERGDNSLQADRPIEMLVLDEAHDAPDQLADFIGTTIEYRGVVAAKIEWPGGENWETWVKWGGETVSVLGDRIMIVQKMIQQGKTDPKLIRDIMRWKGVLREATKLATARGEWVVEEDTKSWRAKEYGPSVRFDPLWPKEYSESALFRGVKRVVLVSATVRPKTAELLGISPKDLTFVEFPSTFPLARRPVIHVPTVQLSYRSSDQHLMWWLRQIDAILEERPDRKGVIHTVSYDRATLILENSRYSSRMLSHKSKDRAEVVQKFKESSEPLVLVSPSVDTGYDFPYNECEFQIISKVPFADNRAKIIKRRMESDKQFSNYMTAQTLVQMTGRGMRAEDDQCETLIVDDNIQWFVNQNWNHFPKWWLDSYSSSANGRPKPLPKL